MNFKQLIAAIAFISLFTVYLAPVASASGTPVLTTPSSLPAVTYYINGTENHYTITSNQWTTFIQDIYNNHTYVSYNWSQNATEDLILFDLSYTGLNPYGSQVLVALSHIGFPSVKNFTLAFNETKDGQSLVTSGGSPMSNIQALNSGAYPGFSWSQPKVKPLIAEYQDAGIIAAIVIATFVLYFYFNRKR